MEMVAKMPGYKTVSAPTVFWILLRAETRNLTLVVTNGLGSGSVSGLLLIPATTTVDNHRLFSL
ncbi:hypothetical protein Hanom_Chr05g00401771 [Helianthus anomalus]